MAGVVVSGGSEEAPSWFLRQRLLGFLALLLLVLARSASAGVVVRERTDDGGNRGRDYLQTFGRGDNTNQWSVIRLNDSFAGLLEWQRPDDSRTRDRGSLLTSNNNKYYDYGASTSVADKGTYDEDPVERNFQSLDDEKLQKKTLLKHSSGDPVTVERPTYARRRIVVPVFLLSACLYCCAWAFGRKEKQQEEAREEPQVQLRLFVPAQRPPAAEDETETQDQDTEAPPTYSDALKSESPPAYSEVCAEET